MKSKKFSICSIHSQKGGVGKTSISIGIAGYFAILKEKKTLFIDADLTGTSIADLSIWAKSDESKYFNDLILADPKKFLEYTSQQNSSIHDNEKFYSNLPNTEIYFMPSSPYFEDIQRIIPLISQECYVHFFRSRLEDIFLKAIYDNFEVVIIDHPPGLFGISNATLNFILNHNENNKDRLIPKTRLEALFSDASDNFRLKYSDLNAICFLITTPDPTDYRALLPSFSYLINNEKVKRSISMTNLGKKINIMLNKAITISKKERYDPVIIWEKIFDNLVFPTSDSRNIKKPIENMLRKQVKRTGAFACRYIEEFDLNEIVPTFRRIKQDDSKRLREGMAGMEEWCNQLIKILDTCIY